MYSHNTCRYLLVDPIHKCQLINLAHIRHDHIPVVRASGGPLYQKRRRMSPDSLSWRVSWNRITVWLRETTTTQGMTVQPGEWLCSPGNDCTAWGITVQPGEWLYSLRNDCTYFLNSIKMFHNWKAQPVCKVPFNSHSQSTLHHM